MKIKKIVNQHRRDFSAEFECEHCGNVVKGRGYDDSNFHDNVIPDLVCIGCGKKADGNYRPLRPLNRDGVDI